MYSERERLFDKYSSQIEVNLDLSRELVSYQANKHEPIYGWFKYREGFAAALVRHVLSALSSGPGVLLDPFAGAGTALFAAQSLGWETAGIELLPVGVAFARARLAAARVSPHTFREALTAFMSSRWHLDTNDVWRFPHIPITAGAFPPETEQLIGRFRSYCQRQFTNENIRSLFEFACLCVLEDVSFTRKDGQYLRWDRRARRKRVSNSFTKGHIKGFREAIVEQLHRMACEMEGVAPDGQLTIELLERSNAGPAPQILEGSSLELLPTFPDAKFDFIFTSPPYCNRYDYTRTYALELAYLGYDSKQVSALRQRLLTCTVENREKVEDLKALYSKLGRQQTYGAAEGAFLHQAALQEILELLERKRLAGELNNANIVRMVRNYFFEMSLVVFEIARLLAPAGHAVMVNDNVRYTGEEVPVDLILSELAVAAGLIVERIWTLESGKGNSSQQMGAHGRAELRKCIYIWRRPQQSS